MTVTTATSAGNVSQTKTSRDRLRIVLAGGSWHLGRILNRHFSKPGHAVTTLARTVNPTGGTNTVLWDGRNPAPWIAELEDADVVINLAGRSVDCRYNSRNRKEILESRIESTKATGEAIAALRHPPGVWLNASTATMYRDGYDREMDDFGELGVTRRLLEHGFQFSFSEWPDAARDLVQGWRLRAQSAER